MDAMPTAEDVTRLTALLPMQVKMLKTYKHYEQGATYQVSARVGEVILNGLYGYRVD